MVAAKLEPKLHWLAVYLTLSTWIFGIIAGECGDDEHHSLDVG